MVTLAKGETLQHAGEVEALGSTSFGERSLRRLFIDHGTTPEAVAALLPFFVDPALFYRVDAKRQPLPADVAEAVARVLVKDFAGNPTVVDPGTVNGYARLTTKARGEYVRRPLPPDPLANPNALFGEQYYPPQLVPYGGTKQASGVELQLWSFGDTSNWQETNRSGASGGSGTFSGGVGYFIGAPCAYDGNLVWTVGQFIFVNGIWWNATFSTSPVVESGGNNAATVPFVDGASVVPVGLVFEPVTARLWFTDSQSTSVMRIDPATGNADARVVLMSGGHAYAAAGLVAVGGKLYASASYHGGFAGEDGRLFEIDPVGLTVTRVSTGANAGYAPTPSLEYDPASATFFIGGLAGFTYANGNITAVPRGSFVGANLSLTLPAGAPALSGYSFLRLASGFLWAHAQDAGTTRSVVLKFSLAGAGVGFFETPDAPVGAFGMSIATDGQGFVWWADGATTVRLFSAEDPGPALAPATSFTTPAATSLLLIQRGVAPALVP